MRQKVRQYKQEIAYLLTVMPRGEVKRKLYDDKQRHRELGITENTLDRIWTDLMARRNPLDVPEKRRRVVVYYRKSKKLAGVFPTASSVARHLGVNHSTVSYYLNKRQANAVYLFKEELR